MSDNISDSLLDPTRIEGLITHETRSLMAQMLEFSPTPVAAPSATAPVAPPLSVPSQLHQTLSIKNSVQNLGTGFNPIPTLIHLMGRILHELETDIPRLLTLNPSRREAIAQHLDKLAGVTSGPAASPVSPDPNGRLRRWIEGPRSASQNTALRAYFEEIGIISLGQAILLKNWSDREIRKWNATDLGRLNWALSTALKPHVPIDRESWQITRPNLYSWFNPSSRLQSEIWTALDSWKIAQEGPGFLWNILRPVRKAAPEGSDPEGYDSRFFKAAWDHMNLFGFKSEPDAGILKRNKIIFSPTLRNGSVLRSGPNSVNWIGLESSPFQLMVAELMQIWWGPTAPPFWAIGTGLEVHARDQLALELCSSKPSVISRIAEMEACDAAFVLEEQVIRAQGQGRSANSNRFRELVESLPYFKKIRSSGTSLGDLQACVALSKLRPGGILFWAREEALGVKDGSETLNFLLSRAKLICEWDFSELEHSLPASIPLYPKHLYLFQKEVNIEARLSHRPVRHSLQGQMRSHVELSLILEDAFQSIAHTVQPRGHWTILSHVSPTPQRDWLEKWPDPTSLSVVRNLDQLRIASLPLANFTTIRTTPEGDPNHNGKWSVLASFRGFWLTAENDAGVRKLLSHPLPGPGEDCEGSGYLILVPEESWVAPLCAYLRSDWVQKWLEHHAERRGERWILNEQVVKWLPIPKTLLQALGVPNSSGENREVPLQLALPDSWEKLTSEVAYQPRQVKEALLRISDNPEFELSDSQNSLVENNAYRNISASQALRIHATVFVNTARALDQLRFGQNRLFSLVTPDGNVRWRELLNILPKAECVTVALHPKVRLSGSLPPHLPIGRIERVKAPLPGILLTTESGFSLHLGSESGVLIQMIWEQLEGLSHPTWNELLQYIKLPRRIELAQSTAMDVLNSHSEQSCRLKDLTDLLAACQLF